MSKVSGLAPPEEVGIEQAVSKKVADIKESIDRSTVNHLVKGLKREFQRLARKRDQLLVDYDKAAVAEQEARDALSDTVGIAARMELQSVISGAMKVHNDLSRKLMACDTEAHEALRKAGLKAVCKDGFDGVRKEASDELWDIYLGNAADHEWYAR